MWFNRLVSSILKVLVMVIMLTVKLTKLCFECSTTGTTEPTITMKELLLMALADQKLDLHPLPSCLESGSADISVGC